MSTFDTTQINKDVWSLWERTFTRDAHDVFVPLQYPPARRNALLFVGLNPSFSEKGFSILQKQNKEFSSLRPREFYLWSNRKHFDPKVDEALDRVFRDQYPYFSKLRTISHHSGLPWEHADLFFFRCTRQNDFKKMIQDGRGQLNDFALNQLTISQRLIAGLEPSIIVVVNAFASRIFMDQFHPEYDSECGYHITDLQTKRAPTFLASMLTGQRAMDVYSFERHVRKAVFELNK